jgi:hypothetical protein
LQLFAVDARENPPAIPESHPGITAVVIWIRQDQVDQTISIDIGEKEFRIAAS